MSNDTTLLQLTYISRICPDVSEHQIALIHQQAERNNARSPLAYYFVRFSLGALTLAAFLNTTDCIFGLVQV